MIAKLRFAPSPSGWLHPGNMRVALQNYFLAKKLGGHFILRIDNTDVTRCKQEFIEGIREDLSWCGIHASAEFQQADRTELYAKAQNTLIEKKLLYPCFETPDELDSQRRLQRRLGKPPIYNRNAINLSQEEIDKKINQGEKPHWRFLLPKQTMHWHDMCKGKQSIGLEHLSDPVLIRADETLTYLLASTVDDLDMGITHVVRGEDHITNTAIHIALALALKGESPFSFAHTSLLHAEEGCVLSKSEGSCGVRTLREEGILPEALVYYLTSLGASSAPSHKTSEALQPETYFDITQYSQSSPLFSLQHLRKINIHFLHNTAYDKLPQAYKKACPSHEAWSCFKDNITSTEEAAMWFEILNHQPKQTHYETEEKAVIQSSINALSGLSEVLDWAALFKSIQKETSLQGKSFFLPLRRALTGMDKGPCLSSFAQSIGLAETLNRLKKSL